ncbi:dopamine beta-hydroxylase-like [Brevipalpus obovatus]|uniref:dopamine beta-hydroxylase-like n=1 Tax=Brevipalpus obovatus TaxID=246614 RepID=UPI003D9FA761
MRFSSFLLFILLYLNFEKIYAESQSKLGFKSGHQNFSVFQTALDGSDRFRLFWSVNYDLKSVNFEVRLRTNRINQWFAIGLSDYGEVSNADFCIIWFDYDSKVHFQDTWTDSQGFVNLDTQDDCILVKYKREGHLLRFLYQKDFDTCDEKDKIIEDGTSHIVWAIGKGPIEHEYGLNLLDNEHGFQRVSLLKPSEIAPPLPKNTKILDVHNENVPVPSDETTYWCKLFKFPRELEKKHHIIRYEANIQPENVGLVHHMELFHCEIDASQDLPDWNGPCFDPKKPPILEACKKVLSAWAMGAGPFSYPHEAGSPFGGKNFSRFSMLEIHYNNEEKKSGIIDNSGLRIYYTPTLRKYDVGVLEIGLEYTDKNSIPPGQSLFDVSGYCVAECTRIGIPPDGITVFASQLHTHLTGVRVWTRHIRGGIELSELNRDDHYSPHFQEIRMLRNKVKVIPGDILINTCRYKTTERMGITLGGYGIRDEMCVNYIHYYPRAELEVCKSSVDSRTLGDYFEHLRTYENQNTSENYPISTNYRNIDWSTHQANQLNSFYLNSPLSMQCNKSSGDRFPGNWEGISLPEVRKPLEKSNSCGKNMPTSQLGRRLKLGLMAKKQKQISQYNFQTE